MQYVAKANRTNQYLKAVAGLLNTKSVVVYVNVLTFSLPVDSLLKNKQRLHLAKVALTEGLISPQEYERKQREFLCAFNFF